MKSSVSNPTMPFIIMCCTLMGLASGCASQPLPAIKSHPGPEARSGSVQTIPYRVDGRVYYPTNKSHGFVQEGMASWYGRDFHGKLTSNGEVYNMNALTAAHKTLPFNTIVQVTHLGNGKSVNVRINDRGPFAGTRIIDLSYGAAKKLDMVNRGTAPVSLRVIQGKQSSPLRNAAGASAKKEIYSVQVGVFANLDNARKISRQFNNSRIFAVKHSNRKIYKVLVGQYSNYEKALGTMDKIRLGGYEEAFIILSP